MRTRARSNPVRAAAWLAAAILLVAGAAAAAGARRVVIVLSSAGVPAYRAAVAGLQSALTAAGLGPVAVFEMQSDADPACIERVRQARPDLLIPVGSRAANVAAEMGVPHVAMMLLDDEAGGGGPDGRLTRVTLDVPHRVVFARVRQLFPQWKRIAVVRERGQAPPAPALQAEAATAGLSLEVRECSGPKELLDTIQTLRGNVDAAWCLPGRLYEPALVHAMILASIRGRLPLIAFSEGFVRAGALVGFAPEYGDIGSQTADLVRRHLQGQPLRPSEAPRTVRTLVNERVARVLGLRPVSGKEVEFVQ